MRSCIALLLLLSASALAADLVAGESMRILFPEAALACILASVGGAARTAQKVAAGNAKKKLLLVAISDIFLSIVAGFVTFGILKWLNTPPSLQVSMIVIAGFGGSRTLDKYFSKFLEDVPNLNGSNAK